MFTVSDFRYIDCHTHFFPEQLFQAIWSYWKQVYLQIFPKWHNLYEWPTEKRSSFLIEQGVERYTTLNYAHKKGVAEALNKWTFDFCRTHPAAIPVGAAHPDDHDFLEYTERALTDYQFKGLKFQLLVTDFYIHDDRLTPLFEMLHALDKVLVLHAGTAPGVDRRVPPGSRVGVKYFLKYLDKFPENKVIIAHMGGYEYEAFFKIVEENPNIYLDTTMVWGPETIDLFPPEDAVNNIVGEERLLSFMEAHSTQILFGSDFPNIPYPYEAAVEPLLGLNLSREAYDNIFHQNAVSLFRL